MSTIDFTVMFAVWLMFGILGIEIQKELLLSDVELSWITALAVLNGSMWRLPAGIITDRIGGRKVTIVMLAVTAVPAYFVSTAHSYGVLLVLAFLVGFAGNLFSVGIAWNAAWFGRDRQGFALGLFGAGNVGASVTKFIGPPLIAGTAGMTFVFGVQGGWRLVPVIYAVLLVALAVLTWLIVPRHDRIAGSSKPIVEMLAPLKHLRVWRFQPVLRGGLRRLRRALGLAAEVLRRQLRGRPVDGGPAHRDLHLPRLAAASPRRLGLRPDRRPQGDVRDLRGDAGHQRRADDAERSIS